MRFASSPRVVPGVELPTPRTLPSANTNWQIPECQLPNWLFRAAVLLIASGFDGPARRLYVWVSPPL